MASVSLWFHDSTSIFVTNHCRCRRHPCHHQVEIRSQIWAIPNTNFSFYSLAIFVYLQTVWKHLCIVKRRRRRKNGKHFIGHSHPSTKQWDRRWNVFMCVCVKSACQMWIIWAFLSLYYWVRGNAFLYVIMLSSNSSIFRILLPQFHRLMRHKMCAFVRSIARIPINIRAYSALSYMCADATES